MSKIPKHVEQEVKEATKTLVAFYLAFSDDGEEGNVMKLIGFNDGKMIGEGEERYVEITMRDISKEKVAGLKDNLQNDKYTTSEILMENEGKMPKKEDYRNRLG